MELLLAGVGLWSAGHFLPAAGTGLRQKLIGKLGEGPYKGLFALTIVGSVVLMVLGWRDTAPVSVYSPPSWGRHAANGLMFVALGLLAASTLPTNLKRWIRHPQLLGFATWAGAHLLANGDRRSLVLFGVLGVWALLMIAFINRRDGPRQTPERVPLTADLKPWLAAVLVFALLYWLHPIVIGVSARPY